MNVAAVVAEVVVDHHSRQHVEHRSNQEVRAEEGFFFLSQNSLQPTRTSYNDSHRVQLRENKKHEGKSF